MAGNALKKIKSSMDRGIATIGVRASTSLEKSKIRTHIETLEGDIHKILLDIGASAYAVWIGGEEDYSCLNEKMSLVQQKKTEVQSLLEQLSTIDERNEEIFGGTELEEKPTEKTDTIICPNCNAEYSVPVKFCRKCGYEMQEIDFPALN